MIHYELMKTVLLMGFINSLIIPNLVQKIKESFNITCSNICIFISLGTSLVIGTLFSFTFSSLGFITCIWSGLLSFVGADFLYRALENKLFLSLSNLSKLKD